MVHSSQYGFRKKKSTIIQLLTFLQIAYKSQDEASDMEIIFTDFSKAFDRVDRGILLMKLFKNGVRRILIKLLKSHLSNRSESVKVNNEISDPKPVTSGVPQGILGPLCFLIFINDLPSLCPNVTPLLFADDAKFISLGLAKEEFQNDFNVIYNWTVQKNMPFNVDKCTHVSFTKSSNKFCFNNTEIRLLDTQKDLGVIISNDMSWNLHIDKAGLKENKTFFAIKRNISNLNSEAKLNLFKSMLIPAILYGSPCFNLNKNVMSELETIQRRAVKWICVNSVSYKENLKVLGILPLPMYVQLNNLLLLSKLILGLYEACNLNILYYPECSRANLFQVRRLRKAKCEQNFMYQTCRLALKIDIREETGLKQRLLKSFGRNSSKTMRATSAFGF